MAEGIENSIRDFLVFVDKFEFGRYLFEILFIFLVCVSGLGGAGSCQQSSNITCLVFNDSFRRMWRWFRRLKRLIRSWSSFRTSASSACAATSSSAVSCE